VSRREKEIGGRHDLVKSIVSARLIRHTERQLPRGELPCAEEAHSFDVTEKFHLLKIAVCASQAI